MVGSRKRVTNGIKSCFEHSHYSDLLTPLMLFDKPALYSSLPPWPKIQITYHVVKSLKCDEYLR
jgi:hypothetical protein